MIHKWSNSSGDYSGTDISGNVVDGGPNRNIGSGIYVASEGWYNETPYGWTTDNPGRRHDPRQRVPKCPERHVCRRTRLLDFRKPVPECPWSRRFRPVAASLSSQRSDRRVADHQRSRFPQRERRLQRHDTFSSRSRGSAAFRTGRSERLSENSVPSPFLKGRRSSISSSLRQRLPLVSGQNQMNTAPTR